MKLIAFLVLFSVAVLRPTHAQSTAVLSHRLKWQNNDGSMEIVLTCSMPSNPEHFDAHETCTIFFSNSSLASHFVQVHQSDLQAQGPHAVCEYTASVRASGVDEQQSFSANCRRRVRKKWTRKRLGRIWKKKKTDWENPESPRIQVNPFQSYLRRASVSPVQSGPQSSLELMQGSSAVLDCKVANLQNWDDHACQWTFSSGPVVLPMNAQEHTTKFGNRAIVSFIPEQSSCQLKLDDVMPNMGGHWSCTPGPGKDGWVLPSQPVLMTVHGDSCQQDSDCPIHDICGKTEPSDQFRNCVNVCHTNEGRSVCGNVPNAACVPDNVGILRRPSCVCKQGFLDDPDKTSSSGNGLRCIPECQDNHQCGLEDICQTHPLLSNARVCKPWCLVSPCGQGASCSVATKKPTNTKIRTCTCQSGWYPFDAIAGAQAGCGPPAFKSFFMTVNGTKAEGCVIEDENTRNKDCSITVDEGSELSITFEAPEAFPEATFELSSVDSNGTVQSMDLPSTTLDDASTTTKDLADRKVNPDGIQIMLSSISATVYHQRTLVCKMKQRGFQQAAGRAIHLKFVVAVPERVTEIPLLPRSTTDEGTEIPTLLAISTPDQKTEIPILLPSVAPADQGTQIPLLPRISASTQQGILSNNGLFTIILVSVIGGTLLVIIIIISGFLMSKSNNSSRQNVTTQSETTSKENDKGRGSVTVTYDGSQLVATIHPLKRQEAAAEECIYESMPEDNYTSTPLNQFYEWPVYQNGHVSSTSRYPDEQETLKAAETVL